eukprot:861563-Amphidinium_carterae.1
MAPRSMRRDAACGESNAAACIQAAASTPSLKFNSVLITATGKVQPTSKQSSHTWRKRRCSGTAK